MNKIYSRIESIVGNVIAVKAQDVAYGELAQVKTRYGMSLAETIRLDKEMVFSRCLLEDGVFLPAMKCGFLATRCR